jgi:vacuolar-type H+-ATPase subunit I/STV1
MKGKRRAPAQPDPETDEALTDSPAEPGGFADAAGAAILGAEEARTRGTLAREEAQERVSAAQSEAARIIRDAEAEARKLIAQATAADREASELEERGGYLRHAAQLEDQAGEADRRVADLEAEQVRLADQVATLDERLTGLDADRDDVQHQLSAARDTGDLDAITQAQGRLAAIADLAATLTTRRAAVAQRAEAIGDGTGRGELHDAQAVTAAHRAELRRLRAILDPEGPEAREAEWQAVLAAQRERIAEDAARKPPVPQQIVRLG